MRPISYIDITFNEGKLWLITLSSFSPSTKSSTLKARMRYSFSSFYWTQVRSLYTLVTNSRLTKGTLQKLLSGFCPLRGGGLYLIFVIFLHGQNFWRIKFTPKKRVNYDKVHRKLPIFCVITN